MPRKKDVGFVVVPPDGGWGWVIVFAAFVCNFIADGIMYSFGLFIDSIHKEFQESFGRITRVGSFQSGFYFLVGPLVCSLVNTFGYRIVTFCGGLISAAAYCGSSFIEQFWALELCNGVLAGVGLSMIYAPSTIVIGFYFEKWRALASGVSTCGSGIGTLLLPPVFTAILEKKGRIYTYRVIAVLLLFVSAISLLYRPLKPLRVYSEGTSGICERETSVEKVKKKLWKLYCCRKMGNRYHPTTDQLVMVERVQIDQYIYDSSSSEEEEDAKKECPKRLPLRRHRWLRSECCRAQARPIYRDDIFYHHSLMLLPNYKEKQLPKDNQRMRYHMSVTRLETKPGRKRQGRWCHPLCRALSTVLDVALLRSYAFHIYLLSGLFLIFGYLIPFLYIKNRATNRAHMNPSAAVWLISAIGLANSVGRIICGVLPSIVKVNVVLYTSACLCIGGVMTILSNFEFMFTIELQFTYAAIYGWAGACIAALRPIIVVEQFGLEHLTNAFGLQMLVQGAGVMMGTATAGALVDATGNFLSAFYMAGTCLIAAGLIFLVLKPLRDWEKKRGILN